MDREKLNDDVSVEGMLSALAPHEGWRPDRTRALAKLGERDRRHRRARKRWLWSAAAASVVCLGILAAPASCEAASRAACRQPFAAQLWRALFQQRFTTADPAVADFHQSGSPSAPITCEIYSDYECPGCAAFFLETMPLLDAEFVRTGKVKIIHRDLPLPQHRYARLAARYANAAGSFGQYDLVVNQLFRTQRIWDSTGDIDKAVMEVLSPGLLQKVRDQAANGGEQSIKADLARARQDQIRGTPSLVVVAHGKRQVISPIPNYSLLKSYLESLLAK